MTTKELAEIVTKMCDLMEGLQIADANDVMFILNRRFKNYKNTSIFSTKGLYIAAVDPYKKQ